MTKILAAILKRQTLKAPPLIPPTYISRYSNIDPTEGPIRPKKSKSGIFEDLTDISIIGLTITLYYREVQEIRGGAFTNLETGLNQFCSQKIRCLRVLQIRGNYVKNKRLERNY